jgi:uncharacterized protein
MHPDLDRVIRLQRIDTETEEARRLIATVPERSAALAAHLDAARAALERARERKTQNENERRLIERDRAAIRTRRSKYQDQTMAVKTNREFHALQKEIEAADHEIARLDDRDLELMMAADEIAAELGAADAGLQEAERTVATERAALQQAAGAASERLGDLGAQRAALAAELPGPVLQTFEQVARTRKGLAVAEARDGLCTVCHVRVRPAIYYEVRRNTQVLQCENCQRILFFVPPPAAAPQAADTPA